MPKFTVHLSRKHICYSHVTVGGVEADSHKDAYDKVNELDNDGALPWEADEGGYDDGTDVEVEQVDGPSECWTEE